MTSRRSPGLRDAAREASAQAPSVTVELLRRAEALLPGGHRDADLVSAEVVQALLRAGKVAEASARAEAVLARQHAAEVDTPLRLALVGALALQNRADELITVVAGQPRRGPAPARRSGADAGPAELGSDLHRRPPAGESAAARALAIAEQAGDAAMSVWALTALLVAVGRQGRFDEALTHARRAAALAADSPDTRSLPLQPKFFLGLALFDCDLVGEARAAFRAALDDEFGSAWWLSDTLMADAQASFAVGEWDDAVPGLIAGGQAAQEKDNQLLVSQSLAYRTIIATATGDHRAARELADGFTGSLEGEQLSYNAGVLAFAAAGLKAAEGDPQGAYRPVAAVLAVRRRPGEPLLPPLSRPGPRAPGLALGHRDVAAEVADTVTAGVALAPEVPTVRSLALRCQGLVDGEVEPLIEAVTLARQAPLLVEHAGACEDAASAAGAGRVAGRGSGAAGRGTGTLRAGWRRCLGWPGPGEAAVHRHPSRRARAQAPAHGRLGKSHRHRAGGVAAGRRGSHQRRRGPADVHLAAHREHPPPACVRQTRRIEPGRARRRGASLDRVMLSPPAPAHSMACNHASCNATNGRATVDHAATMRSTYERINAGDIAGFGDLVADDFVEHQGGDQGSLPPRRGRSTSSVPCSTRSPTCA